MKCEPYKNIKQKILKDILTSKNHSNKEKNEFYSGYEKGVDDSFDAFASYVDLYKHYKNDLKLLMNEQKHVWEQWVQYYEKQKDIDTTNYQSRYNDWLFEYIFYDTKKTKPDDFSSLLL
ncbi:MAG: hypothetical protein V1726_00980 [Methanobacteriota archaeon]